MCGGIFSVIQYFKFMVLMYMIVMKPQPLYKLQSLKEITSLTEINNNRSNALNLLDNIQHHPVSSRKMFFVVCYFTR